MKHEKDPCSSCGCWDSDAEGCTMPSVDRSYGCPLENNVPLEIESKKQIDFFLPMEPPTPTAQEKGVTVRNGKPHFYEKPEITTIRIQFQVQLKAHAPNIPFKGAVRLVTKWCYGIKAKHRDGEYKTSRPDTDGALKLFKDAMTDVGYWKDDAQVSSEITEKFWANRPGIYVSIEEL